MEGGFEHFDTGGSDVIKVGVKVATLFMFITVRGKMLEEVTLLGLLQLHDRDRHASHGCDGDTNENEITILRFRARPLSWSIKLAENETVCVRLTTS